MQIRVLHLPLVHKSLITSHTAPVVDHCMKMTYFLRSDTTKAPVVASLDADGRLCIHAYEAPVESSGPDGTQKLVLRDSLLLQLEPAPDAKQAFALGLPAGLVQVRRPHRVALFSALIDLIDLATAQRTRSIQATARSTMEAGLSAQDAPWNALCRCTLPRRCV